MQALVIGTRVLGAKFCGSTDLGTMAPGKSADFIVLDANPLDNIANTRRISQGLSARPRNTAFGAQRQMGGPRLIALPWTK